VPGFTFAATATAVLAAGAVPVVVDVDPAVFCIDPAAVEAAITPRTRAIIPVHMAGHACAMEPLLALAGRHGLKVIADAAHAHGARWRGESVARLADVAIYSFQAFKLMTAGEGGALVSDDAELLARAGLPHSCGRPRGDRRYQHLVLGGNHRMTEFQGAILRAQLARLPSQLACREAGCRALDERLAAIPGLRPMGRDPDTTVHAHYMYMARVDEERLGCSRDQLVELLVAEGVPAFRSYRTIADLELFHGRDPWPGRPPLELTSAALGVAMRRHPLPVSRALSADALWIHHAVLLGGPAVQDAVAAAFEKIAAQVRASGAQRASGS
jgi:3-amino-5-hydroxybenzoate synthase